MKDIELLLEQLTLQEKAALLEGIFPNRELFPKRL